ncbi:MAG: hypothetical protein M1821_002974 [Bathelium mastoideum]|nr:MAG: hypothetical protein M1821_002974 [Bathelium mastoideum]
MLELNAEHDRRKKLHETYHTAFLLRQKLVPDVVSAIVDYAELFEPHHLCTCRIDPVMEVEQHDSPQQCAKTPPIISAARVQQPVRKVSFDIESHDQGWAGDTNAGTWTWFFARVERQPKEGQQQEPLNELSIPREREIVRNIIAKREFTHHHVEWRADSDDEDEAKWVSRLCVGDVISIHAGAMYSGWVNHIRSVSVSVYTVAMR